VADEFAARARRAAADVAALVPDAERTRRFPVEALHRLGSSGLLRERWAADDASRGALLCEELGRAGAGGVGLGVSVHMEAALSMLIAHGTSVLLREAVEGAVAGTRIVAVAATEAEGGSDPAAVATSAVDDGGALHVRGVKEYVSLGASADAILVLCRYGPADAPPRPSDVLVPSAGVRVEHRHATVGVRSLETVRLAIDARVPREALLDRPGSGLLVLNRGLAHERLATAALAIGTARLAIGLATAHLRRRRSNGGTLFDHQAARLRLAGHETQVGILRRALHSLAGTDVTTGRHMREVAGLKLAAARAGERALSDCMHLFGGRGYLEDATPLARLWRDVRAARVGGGADELMLELVAGGLVEDDEAYRAMVAPAP
jgi:alkylation response protein AidB-like acyl-CoA dehydrogenase